MSLEIRKSIDSDRSLINHIHEQAFGLENSREIITLINDLLQDQTAEPCCSLVAIQQSKIVGHILFSNVKIISDQGVISASILAPLAVIPAAQNQGIGGQLIHDGINRRTSPRERMRRRSRREEGPGRGRQGRDFAWREG